jgi:hypothetical protein
MTTFTTEDLMKAKEIPDYVIEQLVKDCSVEGVLQVYRFARAIEKKVWEKDGQN